MSVLNREEFLNKLKEKIGDSTEDSDLKLIEDFTDTYDDLVSSTKPDGIDWKKKYEDNDKEWRTKYRERFFSGTPQINEPEPEPEPEPEDDITFDDLFTQS